MLRISTQTPGKALNHDYRKEKVARAAIDRLKRELPLLLGRIDAVIHDGPKAKDQLGVMIEAKRTTSVGEMWHPTDSYRSAATNNKALHELVLWFVRERDDGNTSMKTLVITDGDQPARLTIDYDDSPYGTPTT